MSARDTSGQQNYIAAINKGNDPSLQRVDTRIGAQHTQKNSLLLNWIRIHILMMSECSPVGSEPRMFVPKMTFQDRYSLYVKGTESERLPTFGPAVPPLSISHANKHWNKVMESPFLHPETQQYYTVEYRTHLSRGFNQCNTCVELKEEINKGNPQTHLRVTRELRQVGDVYNIYIYGW